MNSKLDEFNKRLLNGKVAIIGLGVSNLPLLDYLYNLGCKDVVLFNDKKISVDVSKYGYQVYEGNGYLDHLVGFDIIFRAPGCLPSQEELVR